MFKPVKIIYDFGGIIMTLILAVGYALCFANIAFIAESKCGIETKYGKIGAANTTIFLILASIIVALTHLLAFIQACRGCCKR